MSIEIYRPNGPNTEPSYPIGTIGLEPFKPKGFFDFFQNIPGYLSMIGGIIIPTYGLWAGPGYAGGTRPTSNPEIKWEQPPCMNDSITKPDANPDECYSLVDAITKTHDWRYVRPLKSIHMLRCLPVLCIADRRCSPRRCGVHEKYASLLGLCAPCL